VAHAQVNLGDEAAHTLRESLDAKDHAGQDHLEQPRGGGELDVLVMRDARKDDPGKG
jgi:hypothetical protein